MCKPIIFGALLLAVTVHACYAQACSKWKPLEAPLPGVLPGIRKPKVLLAQDINYPPYAYLSDSPADGFGLTGFGPDVARAAGKRCGLDVYITQTEWDDCWNGKIGTGLLNGHYHGCMTYTHTVGERNRFLEFSDPILSDNKPAGILTRLEDGKPVVSPMSNLTGIKIVDVKGWAPTSDGLAFIKNTCTGGNFVDYEMLVPSESGNDAALAMLLDGSADAMFVYADQAHNLRCDDPSVSPTWDCSLWRGFGSQFAYIHTGMFGHAIAGTTLSISKKGSGVPELLNPCLAKFLKTKKYYYLCRKYGLLKSCFSNEYFPKSTSKEQIWNKPTSKQTGPCSEGYCSCAAM